MKSFKLNNVQAAKASKYDKTLDSLLNAGDDDDNILAFKEDEASESSGIMQRYYNAFKEAFEKKNKKLRIITVGPVHGEIHEQGYTKMIAVVDVESNEEDDDTEIEGSDGESTNVFIGG